MTATASFMSVSDMETKSQFLDILWFGYHHGNTAQVTLPVMGKGLPTHRVQLSLASLAFAIFKPWNIHMRFRALLAVAYL
jgi:hypothetical protein